MGFTGIDYYSAMLLLSEMGPVTRFQSARKLVSYAGLAPGTRKSAEHTFHGRITKQGNKHIRWILIEAVQNASRYEPKLRGLLPASRNETRTPESHHSRRPQDAGLHLLRIETTRRVPGTTRRAAGKEDKATRTNSGKPSSRMRQPAPTRNRQDIFNGAGGGISAPVYWYI